MSDYSELRRLLAVDAYASWPDWTGWIDAMKAALPELLDENDRLVSKLALANRALEDSNQSITELQAHSDLQHQGLGQAAENIARHIERIAQLEARRQEDDAAILWAKGRIAQLEAALRRVFDEQGWVWVRDLLNLRDRVNLRVSDRER